MDKGDSTSSERKRILASNGLVALLALEKEVFGASEEGAFPESGADLVRTLAEHTWINLQKERPGEVLTGPMMRGDVGTVQAHLDSLDDETPPHVPLYAAPSTEMVCAAIRGGHLSVERTETLLTALRTAAEAVIDSENSSVPLR